MWERFEDKDVWEGFSVSQEEKESAEAERQALGAWLSTLPSTFEVPWDNGATKGVDIFTITPHGIEDACGNWLAFLPPVGSAIQDFIVRLKNETAADE